MKTAVISDLHSNIEALEAVFADIDAIGVDEVISLGDNVGYGADPEAVVQLLISRNVSSILGNHEVALLNDDYLNTFHPDAAMAIKMHRKLLSTISLDFISGLPRFIVKHRCRFVHGLPPDSILEYVSRTSDIRVSRIIELQKQPMSFTGHTHLMMLFTLQDDGLHKFEFDSNNLEPVNLKKNNRYLINAGSVGQPRDGNWRAKYVIWDREKNQIISRYVAYDNGTAASKIENLGLPYRFAQKLKNS